jgi:hypothetical protein
MTAGQIHLTEGDVVQTLAVQPTSAGVWLLSTFAGDDTLSTSEVYIPNAGAPWLAGVVGTMLGIRSSSAHADPNAGLSPSDRRRGDPRAGTVADHIRAIAANPGPATMTELLCIALEVARMELALDEIATDASHQAAIAEATCGTRRRALRAARRRSRLVAVP